MSQPAPDPLLDPTSSHVAISTFDFLLIELVPLAERMARDYEASLDRPSLTNKTTSDITNNGSSGNSNSNRNTGTSSAAGPGTITTTYDGLPETEVFKDIVYFRLDLLGFRVGQGLSERFSRDKPRFTDNLDVIKFLCKDLWGMVFKKQIDNLKTNHRVSILIRENGCGRGKC